MAVQPTTSPVVFVTLGGVRQPVPTGILEQHAQLLLAYEQKGVNTMSLLPTTSPVKRVVVGGVAVQVPLDREVRHLQLLRAVEGLGTVAGGGGGGLFGTEVLSKAAVTAQGEYFVDDDDGLAWVFFTGIGVRSLSIAE